MSLPVEIRGSLLRGRSWSALWQDLQLRSFIHSVSHSLKSIYRVAVLGQALIQAPLARGKQHRFSGERDGGDRGSTPIQKPLLRTAEREAPGKRVCVSVCVYGAGGGGNGLPLSLNNTRTSVMWPGGSSWVTLQALRTSSPYRRRGLWHQQCLHLTRTPV